MNNHRLEIIEFDREDRYAADFLRLPKKLYAKDFLTQNIATERALLSGTHALLKYFEIHKFIAYCDHEPVARWILTEYPRSGRLFIGFFECADAQNPDQDQGQNKKVSPYPDQNQNQDQGQNPCADFAKAIFDFMESYAVKNQFAHLVGPLDCSFWIGYRMKLNHFDRPPYFGETFHKDYYAKMFLDHGFKLAEVYETHGFRMHKMRHDDFRAYKQKFMERQQTFLQNGYAIRKSSKQTLREDLEAIYEMITVLYQDFPFYHEIEKSDFIAQFLPLQKIADLSMIRIALYQGEPVGFIVGLPDHGNIQSRLSRLSVWDLIRVFRNRRRAKRYVLLYMGVLPAHRGLGKAIINDIFDDIAAKKADIIGAFNKEGRKANEYGEGFMDTKYEYGMFTKKVGS
jgi:hypothetical protein